MSKNKETRLAQARKKIEQLRTTVEWKFLDAATFAVAVEAAYKTRKK